MWIILQINCTCFSRICKLLLWQIGINFLLREKNHDYLQNKSITEVTLFSQMWAQVYPVRVGAFENRGRSLH